jgi:hypothetical protein
MRKLTMMLASWILVIVLLPLAVIGVRDILLRQADCLTCRRVFSLVFQPSDLNAPIAMAWIEKGMSRFYLFPRYVGPYIVEVYGASGNSEVIISALDCSVDIGFRSTFGPNKQNEVSSRFGRGLILGRFYLLPENVNQKDRIACDIRIKNNENMLLVVTRVSEL